MTPAPDNFDFSREFTELLVEQLTAGTTKVLQRVQDMANATDDPATTLATITGAAVLLTTEALTALFCSPEAAAAALQQLLVAQDIDAIFNKQEKTNES